MSDFLQLHVLTSYPPSNLNRDDLGRPKTAVMGGQQRLRVSSQSLKRAWRTSSVFQEALTDHVGTRTKEVGTKVYDRLVAAGMAEGKARKSAEAITNVFGKGKTTEVKEGEDGSLKIQTEQLVHYSPAEWQGVLDLTDRLAAENREPTKDDLDLLRHDQRSSDQALFGRMVAAKPAYSVEAAAQVAHAITVHKTAVEGDYFTAVDDLNEGLEDVGAGHLGQIEFGAGLFYLYVCIDRELLVENLGGDEELAGRTLSALVEAITTIAPGGKQATFASRAHASYVLAEAGRKQPRSLAVAFLEPVSRGHYVEAAIEALAETRSKFDRCYGENATGSYELNAQAGTGNLADLKTFAAELLPAEG